MKQHNNRAIYATFKGRITLFACTMSVLAAGCASRSQKISMPLSSQITFTSTMALVSLSESQPINKDMQVQLVNISTNGTVTIKSLDSGAIIQSDANGYFPSKEFGTEGLKVQEINEKEKRVILMRTQCGH